MRQYHGPGWDASRGIREQQAWEEHAAFMDELVEDGFIILGGPLGNGDRTVHVAEAAAAREIEARLGRGSLGVDGDAPGRFD